MLRDDHAEVAVNWAVSCYCPFVMRDVQLPFVETREVRKWGKTNEK